MMESVEHLVQSLNGVLWGSQLAPLSLPHRNEQGYCHGDVQHPSSRAILGPNWSWLLAYLALRYELLSADRSLDRLD